MRWIFFFFNYFSDFVFFFKDEEILQKWKLKVSCNKAMKLTEQAIKLMFLQFNLHKWITLYCIWKMHHLSFLQLFLDLGSNQPIFWTTQAILRKFTQKMLHEKFFIGTTLVFKEIQRKHKNIGWILIYRS